MRYIPFLTIAAAAIFLSGCDTMATEYNPTTDNHEEIYVSKDEIYSKFLENFEKGSVSIGFDAPVDNNDVSSVIKEIKNKYPEYFWIDTSVIVFSESKGHTTCKFNIINDYTADELLTMTNELQAAAENIISAMPAGLDDYGKALYVHDAIAETTFYDTSKIGIEDIGLWDTAYGCLVEGKAVCSGYSYGFQYIMNQLDIECGVISGKAINNSSYDTNSGDDTIGHAWNYVKINGRNYWVDVTWDDIDDTYDTEADSVHTFFLVNDERLLQTRTIDADQNYIPACYTMDDNYHIRNNSFLNDYNKEEIGNIMAASADKKMAEIMFSSKESYNIAINALFEKGELWELSDYVSFSDYVSYILDDDMKTIVIFF